MGQNLRAAFRHTKDHSDLGVMIVKILTCPSDTPVSESGRQANVRYDPEVCKRHIQAFGTDMQDRLSDTVVGIGSAGGIGMCLIEQLMRLYPRKIIIADFDTVAKSNLNRLPGATELDARLQTPKVNLALRHVLEFNPNQDIVALEANFLDRECQEEFRECDVFFSCFDRIGPRLAANQLCLVHGILLFDLGVGAIMKDGVLSDAGGQVISVSPDSGFCLSCSGYYDKSIAAEDFMDSEELARNQDAGYIRGANIDAPQVYALNSMVASWAVWLFMRTLTGENIEYDGIAVDALRYTSDPLKEERLVENNCPVCGENGLALLGDDGELLVRNEPVSDGKSDFLDRLDQNQPCETSKKSSPSQKYENAIPGFYYQPSLPGLVPWNPFGSMI